MVWKFLNLNDNMDCYMAKGKKFELEKSKNDKESLHKINVWNLFERSGK